MPPSCSSTAFGAAMFTATPLYVQEASLKAYQADPIWGKFTTIRAYDGSGNADDDTFVMGGVTYRQVSKDDKTVIVIYNDTLPYTGNVAIKNTVNYADVDFTVIGIDAGAFKNCANLTQISLSDGINEIGANAFEGCTGLKYFFEYKTTPPTLGENALAGINKSACKLYVPDDVRADYLKADQWKDFANTALIISSFTADGLNYIVTDLINNTVEFTKPTYPSKYEGAVVIPDEINYRGDKFTCTGIGENAFWSSSVTSLKLPSTLKYVANSGFSGLGEYDAPIDTLVIPEGVTSIGGSACYAAHIRYIELPKKSLVSLGNSAFYGCDIEGIIVPASIKKIPSSCFSGTKLRWVEIQEGIEEIGESAFWATDLAEITIPNSVRKINDQAFAATDIASATFGTGLQEVVEGAFYACNNLYKLFIFTPTPPAGLEDALYDTGRNMSGRVTYAINNSYKSSTGYGTVKVRSDLANSFSLDGIRYLPSASDATKADAIDASYDRANTVVKVADKVSYNGKDYEVTSLATALVLGNPFMTAIDYTSAKPMPARFAYNAPNLSKVNLPEGMRYISEYGFGMCDSLRTIKLPSTIETLDIAAFYLSGLDSISIPASVTMIDNAALGGCRKLSKFVLEDGDAEIMIGFYPTMMGNNPMFFASPLKEVYCGRKMNYMTGANYSYSPFYNDTILETVKFGDIPVRLTIREFGNCKMLKSFTAGNGLQQIASNAFAGCISLDSISIGSALQSVDASAFSECAAVGKFYCMATTPPIVRNNGASSIDQSTCVLYVPASALADYKAAPWWRDFFSIEGVGDADGIDLITSPGDGRTVVYDLRGVMILDTDNSGELNDLPAGIYIVNGKKMYIGR